MSNSVKVTVPATTSNLGPGLDVIGLAVNLRNEVIFRASGGFRKSEPRFSITIEGEGEGILPSTLTNLVVRAAWKVFDKANRWPAQLEIRQLNHIPLSSGMGSSAAAVVSGLVAANELVGCKLSNSELLDLAVEIEGHPDNVAPALHGGLTLCASDEEGHVHILQPKMRTDLAFLFCVPNKGLSTNEARKGLPAKYERADVVFNLSRLAFLTTILQTGRTDMLRFALQDRVHQRYRDKLMPGLLSVVKAAEDAGALGACLSGSGPTILAITDRRADSEKIAHAMREAFALHGMSARTFPLRLSKSGANATKA